MDNEALIYFVQTPNIGENIYKNSHTNKIWKYIKTQRHNAVVKW